MNIVPITFAFDNNIVGPACVCITSLMENAAPDTFYDIFILHSKDVKLSTEHIDEIPKIYSNCRIRYIGIDNTFSDAFEIRGVTVATYYRLLLSELISEYDKIIYADVDFIFRMDLSEVYSMDISDYYLAATLDLGLNFLDTKHIAKSPELESGKYIQAGFAVFNLKKIREDGLASVFAEHVNTHKYTYQDQDILNICCKGKIKYLAPCYNVNDCSFIVLRDGMMTSAIFTEEEREYACYHGNLHYSGKKPWKENSICMDIWWEYYRKSPIFDIDEYFGFFFKQTLMLDSLPLWKRIKILGRYFIYGRT